MQKVWEVKEKKYEDVILQLLFNRGIDVGDKNSIESFLNPNFNRDFHDSFLLPDFKIAIKRIKKAIENKEKIGIYADYDADGIPGAALLFRTLKLFDIVPEIYIPTRTTGYGFNQSGLDYLINRGCKLIISVDLGIKEFKLSKYVGEKKVDLIITDHHLPDEKLPLALAVINPKIKSSKYPFRELSGAGVVYKLIQGLAKIYPKKITESFLKWNLDLVAISTISDIVPLVDENRIIAKYGLLVLAKSKNLGVRAISKKAKITSDKFNSYSVGFQIGPRINAPGRIDHATASFEILVTDNEKEAEGLAAKLEEQNVHRQNSMERIFREAANKIERGGLLKEKIVILSDPNWPKGVIGPVASNLVEKYHRPVILFQETAEEFTGSCRSISGLNIVELLKNVEKFTIGFGGHAGAAGVQIKKTNFQKFKNKILAVAKNKISDSDLLPKLKIDLELLKNKISVGNFKEIEKLEPFGLGNPRPVFLTKSIKLLSHRLVGRDSKHLQFRFSLGFSEVKGISFNSEIEHTKLKIGENYDIVYTPGLNFWNGKWWSDLQIVDIKES